MKSDMDQIKKRMINQISEDIYSRYESTEDKIQRLKKLQEGENEIPEGLEINEEVRLPNVAENHGMLLKGLNTSVRGNRIDKPKGFRSDEKREKKSDMDE